jgi:release factor glutamine methyltransferase
VIVTCRELLRELVQSLEASPELRARGPVDSEAEQLLMAALGLERRSELFLQLNDGVAPSVREQCLAWSRERARGRILQHLIGHQQFLDHRYQVGPEVLVPRPETELLVVTAIDELLRQGSAEGLQSGLEIGLGSGVISIELLHRFSSLQMTASELTPQAEAVARKNADAILGSPDATRRLRVIRAGGGLRVAEPFRELGLRAQFLISNPPYLAPGDPVDADVLSGEPATALFSPGPDGMHFYRKLAEEAREVLLPGGFVFLEMPAFRAVAIEALFSDNGWRTRGVMDLAGLPRVLVARS